MRIWLCIAAVNGALAVLLGAFAAHGLSQALDAHHLSVFDTGARYHMTHALAMGLAALAGRDNPARNLARWAAIAFLTGIILFCGSLYALALTGIAFAGIITPFGGLGFIGGWLLLAAAAWKGLR